MKGFVVSGTGSGVGKTSIAAGLMSRLSKSLRVQAFKAGPDFIDPMYHRAATGRPSRNLDSFLLSDDRIRNVVGYASRGADVCVVEGVRGLYEGFSGDSDVGSTAHIAKLLGFPVVLVVDAGSLTRSAAAIVNGFRSFDPDVEIAGVIFNRVSGPQHSDKLDVAMRTYCPGVKVLGKVRRDPGCSLEQRHLGLRTVGGRAERETEALERLADPVDLDMLMGVAEECRADLPSGSPFHQARAGAKVAVPLDDAYSFYYRENIEALEASGFAVEAFSPVAGDPLPDADALYIGGGYPELHAEEISRNRDFLEGARNMALEGKPVLGECGGLMTMCASTTDKRGDAFPMSGIFDAESVFVNRRHGPTYVLEDALPCNPLFSGTAKGHEYHYSEVRPGPGAEFGFRARRGLGISGGMDGLVSRNALGTYMHQHALSMDDWAKGFRERLVRSPVRYLAHRSGSTRDSPNNYM